MINGSKLIANDLKKKKKNIYQILYFEHSDKENKNRAFGATF